MAEAELTRQGLLDIGYQVEQAESAFTIVATRIMRELLAGYRREREKFAGNVTFAYQGGGLVTDIAIPGITNPLRSPSSEVFYGGKHMVCESLSRDAAKMIAHALGGKWSEVPFVTLPPLQELHDEIARLQNDIAERVRLMGEHARRLAGGPPEEPALPVEEIIDAGP